MYFSSLPSCCAMVTHLKKFLQILKKTSTNENLFAQNYSHDKANVKFSNLDFSWMLYLKILWANEANEETYCIKGKCNPCIFALIFPFLNLNYRHMPHLDIFRMSRSYLKWPVTGMITAWQQTDNVWLSQENYKTLSLMWMRGLHIDAVLLNFTLIRLLTLEHIFWKAVQPQIVLS